MSVGHAPKSAIPAVELGDDPPFFEIIDGIKVDLPPMSSYAVRIANILSQRIAAFAEPQDLGESIVEDIFNLRLPLDRNRRPDVAFISRQRWPKDRPQPTEGDVWDVVPDLIVEVVSPSDKAEELRTKVREYFEAGARQVWVIYPRERQADLFQSLTSVRVLTDHDDIDGGDVLPGFRLPLARLFPPAVPRDLPPTATPTPTNGTE
jgi:Uma2 family endonuclease